VSDLGEGETSAPPAAHQLSYCRATRLLTSASRRGRRGFPCRGIGFRKAAGPADSRCRPVPGRWAIVELLVSGAAAGTGTRITWAAPMQIAVPQQGAKLHDAVPP